MASEHNSTSRRALLGALAVAPFLSAAAAAAAPSLSDGPIRAAWGQYLFAQGIIYSDASDETEVYDVAASQVSAAEVALMRAPAETLAGVMTKLLIALPHIDPDAWVEEAIASGNVQRLFDREAELDFGARLIVQALRDLTKIERGGKA